MDYQITGTEKDGDIYYYVNWSPLTKADRWEINAKVPLLAGIFEIYWMDEKNRLRMFKVGKTDYGGLRSELRFLTDPELCINDEKGKKILEEKEIWYRYTCNDSAKVMADILWFLLSTYFPDDTHEPHSGRYNEIYVNQSAPDKLIWVP